MAAAVSFGCAVLFLFYLSRAHTPRSHEELRNNVKNSYHRLRNSMPRYGEPKPPCSCPFKPPQGVNSNGGWFYSKQLIAKEHVAFDPGFGKALLAFIGSGKIIDVGAGVGQLGTFIGQQLGSKVDPIQWCGYDGGNNIQDFWGELAPLVDDPNYRVPRVCWIDASSKINTRALGDFDWAITIEVGEHIPKASEQVFLDNIVSLGRKGVILSWAIPGQGGNQHINEQSNEYVIGEMKKRGLTYNEPQSMKFRKSVQKHRWLRNTIMVFERN